MSNINKKKTDQEHPGDKIEVGANAGCCTPSIPSQQNGKQSSCCYGKDGEFTMNGVMRKCMTKMRWFLLMPIAIGTIFLLLGMYLNPEVTRTLWVIFAGLVVLGGTFGLVMTGLIDRRFKEDMK